MKSRLAVVLAADAVLAALVLAGLLTQAGGRDAPAPLVRLARIPAMDDLVFMNERGQVRVSGRPGGRWSVQIGEKTFPAAGQKVEAFLQSLDRAAVTRTATANRALWGQFEVDDRAKTRIRFNHPREALELILGKPGPGESDVYLRIAGRDEVLLVEGGLVFYAEQGLDYWSELRLFERAFDARELARIAFAGPAGSGVIVRDKDERGAPVWLAEGGSQRPLKQRAVEAWAADLAGATALRFVTEPVPIGPGAETITVTTAKGDEYRLVLGDRNKENEWFASRDLRGGDALVYIIDEAWRARLRKTLADLSE